MLEILEIIGVLLLLIIAFSVVPLRLKFRESAMRKLAQEFGLSYLSNNPRFTDFYSKFLFLRSDQHINVMSGRLGKHSVKIYDVLFPGPRFIFAINYENQCLLF